MRDEERDVEDEGRGVPLWRVWSFLVRQSFRHPWMLAATVVASVGVALSGIVSIGLVLPFLASLGGSALTLPRDFPLAFFVPYFEGMSVEDRIRTIALLLLAIQVVRSLLSYTESRLTAYMKILIEQDLRQQVFDELMAIELRHLQKERIAEMFSMMHTYPQKTATLVDQYLGAMTKTISGAAYVLVLFAISVPLTLVAATLGLLSMLAVRRLNRFVTALSRRINESRIRLHQTSLESLQGIKLIRVFAREEEARDRFLADVRTMRRQSFKRGSITSAMPQIHAVVNILLLGALVLAATVVLDLRDPSWLLQLTLFIFVVLRLAGPLTSLTRKQAKITEDLPAVEELIGFLAARRPRLVEGTRRFERLEREIRFERVSFRYDDAEVLRDVSLVIPRGSRVALVGPSGAGKTTVLGLLSRLADPTEGRILVDGVDLRELDSRTWRRRVAVVSQDTFLFNDTVRANILFGKPDATDTEVEEAARLAGAHAFILELPQGYDTFLGDRGSRLSGGQAQRIAIARAILADPDVLVLDEATSALDTASERAVQDAIDRLARDRTVVAVAHRLSTVRASDVIYVLDAGRVVQAGRHEELLASPGLYRELVELQDLGASRASLPAPARAASPAAMVRVLIQEGSREARLANGEVAPARVPLLSVKDRAEAVKRARSSREAVVVVYPGAEQGVVRLGEGDVLEAPLFAQGERGERRVRVREIRNLR